MIHTRTRGETEEINLRVCGLSIRVRVDDGMLERAIRAAWRPALQPALAQAPPPARPVRDGLGAPPFLDETRREGEGTGREEASKEASASSLRYDILLGTVAFQGKPLAAGLNADEIMACFERHLLDELTRQFANHTLVHAGAVVVRGELVLLLGPSGIGKSTMTREALRAGHEYLTDDFVVLVHDGVLGASRSVQFDPVRTSDLPPYVADCDTLSYRYVRGGQLWTVPLYCPSRAPVSKFSLGSGRVHVCRLRRGPTNDLRRLAAVDKLVVLHEATLTVGRAYDGCLDGAVAWEVVHADSQRAFAQLDSVLAQLP